jgi:hypothetical protein
MKMPAVVCFALSVFSAFGAFKTISEKGFSFTGSNSTLALALLAICMVALAVAFAILIKSRKNGNAWAKDELERRLDDLNTRIDKAQASLFEIPENAKKLDVFYNYYTVKDGKRTVETESVFEYSFGEYTYFHDKENLYFTDVQAKYAIPFSSIKDLKLIESETTFDLWDKDEDMDDPKYEKYDIYDKTEDCISINSYAELYISDNNGDYKIVVPGYEYEKFKELML